MDEMDIMDLMDDMDAPQRQCSAPGPPGRGLFRAPSIRSISSIRSIVHTVHQALFTP